MSTQKPEPDPSFHAFAPRNVWKGRVSVAEDVVIKDYGRNPLRARLLGRLLLSREQRALEKLEGVAGVPRMLARPNPYRIHISRLPGKPITLSPRGEVTEAFLADLKRLIREIHARGVAHADAHARNVLDDGDKARLVDFSTAIVKGDGPVNSLLFRWACALDEWSVFKIERRWFERGDPPRMFFLYRLFKRKHYRKMSRRQSR